MRIDILTLFPEMFQGVFSNSILNRAQDQNKLQLVVHDFREYSKNKHKKVDDYSYGGGQGMVISVEPIVDCLKNIPNYESAWKIITTPQGKTLQQSVVQEFSTIEHLILICGHYEGIDERILHYVNQEVSIGDYILTGGEIAAMAIVDSVARLIPGVLGNEVSSQDESFEEDLLEYPQYTRPLEYDGHKVPDVLLSGHHENIKKWRKEQQIQKTKAKRPDLYLKYIEKEKKV